MGMAPAIVYNEGAIKSFWEQREIKRERTKLKVAGQPQLHFCDKCRGTGVYLWGAVINGWPSRQGQCFQCNGKGYTDSRDRRRNKYYWNHKVVF